MCKLSMYINFKFKNTNLTVLNTKISEVENEIPNHDKYITTSKIKKLTAQSFCSKIKAS